jgi:holin-like protein
MGNRIVQIFTVLLTCQLAGEVVTRMLHLPLPGPVLGMVLLFCALLVRGSVPADLGAVSGELLANLSLLFVPAGVGVMLHARLLADNWLALVTTLVLSATITIGVTGAAMNWTRRWSQHATSGAPEKGTKGP